MTENCNNIVGGHKFFEVKKLSDYVQGSPSYRAAREGVLVVCASCGEVREAWETGEVVIRPAQPATKPYDPNSTGNSQN
jgi:hypothetical protein